ncbi:MAG: TlyA family RNA methyltransferase [Deltaproteobacteria bacterium]|jgi:23S rRNA (cytidine1920-2'-O)/16S rRNA (cytidine1409-2'-O)-methyltransferase|nr:TlyA family RNA methyltransferase [Deltaproteobacteria bacterium]
MPKKQRADALAWAGGLAESREQAARMILAGELFLAPEHPAALPQRVEKAGELLPAGAKLERRLRNAYVSRGAYKLLSALEHFHIRIQGLVAMDAGASTGGFTDCLLRHGAARVYAVDAGKGQLHEKLRRDERVISLEAVNLRLAEPELLPERVDILTADLSFISLKAVLPVLLGFLKPEGSILALIKPQFELGFSRTIKGVVRDEGLRAQAVREVTDFARTLPGLELRGVIPSALKGPKGNQEYMAYWERLIPLAGGNSDCPEYPAGCSADPGVPGPDSGW